MVNLKAPECMATPDHKSVPVGNGRQLGVHDGDRLADGGEGGHRGGLRQPPLVRRGQAVGQRLRAQVQQQESLGLQSKLACRQSLLALTSPVSVLVVALI